MAGFKQRSLSLQQLQSIPNNVDSNSLDIFYLNDGSIRAKAFDGTEYRLDNIDTTLVDVSGQLYSLIQSVSGDLVVYVNEVSGNLYDTFTLQDQTLFSTIESVSGDLYNQIITVDSHAVHRSGNETINGNKIFADTTYFMSGIVVNGEIIDIETTELKIKDNIISLNVGITGIPFLNSGIEVIRGIYPNAQLIWNENSGFWTAGISGNLEKLIRQSDLDSAIASISGGVISNILTDITNISASIEDLYSTIITVSGNLSQNITDLDINLQSQIDDINTNIVDISASIDNLGSIYTTLVTTSNISGNLQNQITNISNNYTLITTTADVSAYLQSEIDNISASNFVNYYSKTEINSITGQQKSYIDGNFVNLSTNQSISGNKSFINNLDNIVLSTQNTLLKDSFGIESINWSSRIASDNLGIDSIDWKYRELNNSTLDTTLNWETKNLYSNWSSDSFNVLSLPASGSGNFLTWNASKLLIDSGTNLNSITSTTAAVSAYLQAQINSIPIESTTISSSSGNIIVSNIGSAFNINVADYISKTIVSNISAGLEGQIVEISGNVQTNTQNINTILTTYTSLATTQAISAGLQNEIDSLSSLLTNVSGNISQDIIELDLHLQSQIDQISGNVVSISSAIDSISGSFNSRLTIVEARPIPDIFRTEVSNISAGLEGQIVEISGNVQTNTQNINTILSTYTSLTTTQAISAGLDSRLTIVEARPIPDIFRTEVSNISASLEGQIVQISGNVQTNTQNINTILSTYTSLATTQAISAGLDSRLTIVEARPIPNIFFAEVSAISADLFATDQYLQLQIDNMANVSGAYALDINVVHKSGNEVINGIKSFTNSISGNIDNTSLDIGTNYAQSIQIGGNNTNLINIAQGSSPTVINIGSPGDTVNIIGDLVYVKSTNSEIVDKTITINASGALGSSNLAGIYVEENNISGAGFARIDNNRNSWAFKAPNSLGSIWLTPSTNNANDSITSSSTIDRSFILPNNSGTFALISDIPLSNTLVHTSGNESIYGIKNFYYPSNSLSISTSGVGFYDITNNKSIDWNNGLLYTNTSNNKSIDYANRYLYTASGFTSLNWESKKLFDSNGYTSYDWGQRLAWYNNNTTIALNFSNNEVVINDISGAKSLSSNRTLLNSGESIVVDWESKKLYGEWNALNGIILGTIVPVEYNSTKITSLSSLNVVVDTIATSSNDGSSWKVIITDGTNKRISSIDSIFTNSLIEYMELGTKSIGDTSMVTLSCDINSGNARLLASATSGTWTIKVARINF